MTKKNLITYFALPILLGAFISLVWLTFRSRSYNPPVEEPVAQVDSLLLIAEKETKVRKMKRAFQHASRALQLSREQDYRHGEIKSLRIMGFAIEQAAQYDSSIAILMEARTLGKKYHINFAERGFVSHYLGSSYLWKGDFNQALKYYQEALKFFTEADTLIGAVMVHHGMGLAYAMQALYPEATGIWQQGLALVKKFPKKHYYELALTGNLGKVYQLTGQMHRAIPMIERSLTMARKLEDRRAEAVALEMLGEIQSIRGNFRKALQNFTQAARLREKIEDVRGIILSHLSLASIYDALNDYDNAEYYYEKGIETAEKKLNKNSPLHVNLYQNLGWHWMRRGDYAKAETHIQKTIEGSKALNLRDDLVKASLALAELRFRQEKYDGCLKIASVALRLAEDIQSASLSKVYLQIGRVNHALGKRDSAFAHYNRAIESAKNFNEAEIAWQAHFHLALYYQDIGNLRKAAQHSEHALAAIEQLRRYTISPELGSRFLANKVEVYQHYFEILFETYQRGRTKPLLDSLYAISEKTRSRALFDDLRLGEQNIFFQVKESSKLQDIEEQIVSLNLLIRKAKMQPGEKRQPKLIASLSEQVESLQSEYALKTAEFAASKPELSALLGVSSQTSIEDLQKALNPASTFISYYFSLEDVYAFVINATDATLIKLNASPSELWERVRLLRKPFQDFKEGRIDFLRLAFNAELSHQLFQQLVAPLSEYIGNNSSLMIVPAGPLTYLPFEMLVTGKKNGVRKNQLFSEYGQFEYLIEKFTIGYLPAGAMLPLLKRKEISKTEQTLLAFGNPILDASKNPPLPAAKFPPSGLRNLSLTPLPGAALEIRDISNLFGTKEVLALSGGAATESDYKQQSGRFRFIHFATHGYVDERNPNFSALLLNPGDETEDGFLYAYEIYAHPLNAELVSLSACETALGQFRESEGLVSFVQSFFAAGSQSVMGSLWSVAESTYPLMVSFYKNLRAAMPKTEALRQAKLAFMRGASQMNQQSYSQVHPFLWAPFVLYGVE